MKIRTLAAAAITVSTVVLGAPLAYGHASFSAAVNPFGSTTNPYVVGQQTYLTLRVPEERPGPPKLDTVDVKVFVPSTFASPTCDDARSANAAGTAPGAVAAGWSCAVESSGSTTVLHWSRAAGARALGIYFPLTATPTAAGTSSWRVDQTYQGGEVVSWRDPGSSTTGGCTQGSAKPPTCDHPATTRVVTGTANGGYWVATSDGSIGAFAGAPFLGSAHSFSLSAPIVALAATPTGKGYWQVGADGGVFSFGDALYYGGTAALRLNAPIVGIASTPTGKGYWLVGADGGVFAYGDAVFYGSTGAITLNAKIVGLASTPSGLGYWLAAADGGVFSFGDARFWGSAGSLKLAAPVKALLPTVSGRGYRLLAADGGVFAYGDASYLGTATAGVAVAATPSGLGYRIAASNGAVTTFGDAAAGNAAGLLSGTVVGIASAR